MARTFNTAGPCRRALHYMLPPERRLGELPTLIEQEAFFVVHAPRQTGKTTSLSSLARSLTADGRYAAVHASCKPAATAGDAIDRGVASLLRTVDEEARLQLPEACHPPASPESLLSIEAENRLRTAWTRWSDSSPRPLVLFLDEFDALEGKTLQNVLDQLHAGYTARPAPFPQSVALIGLRDVRDYRTDSHGGRLGTSSPFNIKLESLRLRDFTADEVAELYSQHTDETGQRFDSEAVALAFELTRGQPWLVNALARQATHDVSDRSVAIGARDIEHAKETLILRRDTHVDSLIDRLREVRVRRVIEPILSGHPPSDEVLDDDIQFAKDLGLVVRGSAGLEIANPIYHEIVPRALTTSTEEFLPVEREPYIAPDGRLRFADLLEGFAGFWLQHAEHYLRREPYSEAAAQLIFMAYLQRVINGGSPAGIASIDREYAVGSGRIDLCIRWPLASGEVERFAVELKVWRDRAADPLPYGLDQLGGYLDRLELDRGTLLLFDRRSDAPPLPERIEEREVEHGGRRITVWRL